MLVTDVRGFGVRQRANIDSEQQNLRSHRASLRCPTIIVFPRPLKLQTQQSYRACSVTPVGMWVSSTRTSRQQRAAARETETLITVLPSRRPSKLRPRRDLPAHHRYQTPRTACAATESFYSLLGVARDATLAEITSAYRQCVGNCELVIDTPEEVALKRQAIRDAYEVLSNDNKRQQYNLHGLKAVNQQHSKSSKGQTNQYQHAKRGANVSAAIRLSFLEAALGVERDFTASARLQCTDCSGSGISASVQPEDCSACKGSGQIVRFTQASSGRVRQLGTCPACGGKGVQSRFWCLNCGGDGRAVVPRKLRVKIPPGVDESSMLRLNGQGDVGLFGGDRGDLHLRFLVDDQASFVRKGQDVFSTVPISYLDAALGGQIQVQTVQGPMAVKVPSGTQHGTTLKLRDQGVQGWGPASSKFGCHYLKLHLVLPTQISPAEVRLLERLSLLNRT